MPVAALYDVIVGVHIVAVLVAFGWTLGLPLVFAIAARRDPRSLPLLHRFEVLGSRVLLNPALVVVLGAGIYLASDGHHWGQFFVAWGIGAVVVIGAIAGSVMIPLAKRAEAAAARDLQAAGGERFEPGEEYRRLARRLQAVGAGLIALVIATVMLMATNA